MIESFKRFKTREKKKKNCLLGSSVDDSSSSNASSRSRWNILDDDTIAH